MGYNPFMPSYPHIEEYRTKLQDLIELGGSDNEENIRPAFQNCLDAYCRDHREDRFQGIAGHVPFQPVIGSSDSQRTPTG